MSFDSVLHSEEQAVTRPEKKYAAAIWVEHGITAVMVGILLVSLMGVAVRGIRTMEPTNIVNVVMGLCSVFVLVMISIVSSMDANPDDRTALPFRWLVLTCCLGAFFDNVCYVVDGVIAYEWLNYLLVECSFLVTAALIPVFWFYQKALFHDRESYQRELWIVTTLTCADFLYVVISSPTAFFSRWMREDFIRLGQETSSI